MTIAQERLAALIADLQFVSEQQRAAILEGGNFFLLSRPGSGKTRTVGIRMAWTAIQDIPLRVAATSYTNVAIKQVRSTVAGLGVVLDCRHFTGTLHDFLLRYVLRPFGHLVLGCSSFHLIDESWAGWSSIIFRDNQGIRLPVSKFHFRADGSLVARDNPRPLSREQATKEGQQSALQLKRKYVRQGLLSLSDALYYALRVLELYPGLCARIAARFDELIVDEAQDTSDVQLRCLELLHETGKLDSLVLVGDLEQSIYSFQGASPDLCRGLVQRLFLRELPLTRNFRSSQAICNVTYRFCSRIDPDMAAGPNKDNSLQPELFLYPAASPSAAVTLFRSRLGTVPIALEDAVVLARKNAFVNAINGGSLPDLGRGLALLARLAGCVYASRTLDLKTVRVVEQFLAELAWDIKSFSELEPEQRWRTREAVMALVARLPRLEGKLREWTISVREVLKSVVGTLASPPANEVGHKVRCQAEFGKRDVRECFLPDPIALAARTVHDAKGESYKAVLLIAESSRRGGQRQPQTALWSRSLLGASVSGEEQEELRIAYVALTRAEVFCCVALPNDSSDELLEVFIRNGFKRNE